MKKEQSFSFALFLGIENILNSSRKQAPNGFLRESIGGAGGRGRDYG